MHICRFLNRTWSLNRPKANLNLYLCAIYSLSPCQPLLPKIHYTVLPLIEGAVIFIQNYAMKSKQHQVKEWRMKGKEFTLKDKDNTIRSDEMSLKTKTKYTSTSKWYYQKKKKKRKTLGAKPQQEDLLFALAKKEERPWLLGQPHDHQP